MGKRLSFFFVLLLLFQTMTPGLTAPAQIKAQGNKVIDSVSYDGEEVNVQVKWSVEEKDIKSGHTETADLPNELEIEEEQTGALKDGDTEIGTYKANGSTITVTFNEAVEEYPEASGTFTVEAINTEATEEVPEEKVETESTEELTDQEPSASADSPEIEEAEENSPEAEEETGTEDESQSEETEKNNENTTVKNANLNQTNNEDGKHGFNLNLGSVTDLDGNPYSDENLLDPAEEFWLKLDWNLEDGHNYVANDTETFDLPTGIKITEEMTGELRDDFGQLLATYKITPDKKVELTFTDFIEGHSNVQGWLEIISTLDEGEIEVEDGEAILDPIGEEGEIRIPIEQGSKEKTIEKEGTPNKGYNADEINWEVIINKNKTSLIDAKVTDLLPEGTEYKQGSLKVTKLKVDLYGNILGDAEEVDVTGETVVDGELTIPLGDIKDAYRIEYVTTVTDDEKKEFTNNATLTDNKLENISAKSTITINRGEAIKKKAAKGYDPKTGIIEWEIEFNYNEKDLTNVTLSDAWTPEGKLDLVEGSLKFIEMKIDEDGNAHETGNVGLPDGAKLVPGTDQFEVAGITTNKPYKVTYQTKVKDRVLDPIEVANTAGFGAETVGSGTGVGTYYGSKSAGTIDYAAKTIDWKVEINHDEYPMEQISITDTLGDGLTLLKETIEITVDGNAYEGNYTLSGDNPFTIVFPEDFKTDKKIVITYKTNFVADEVPNHKPTNKAAITWTPEGESDSITKAVEAGTELNNNTKNNDWKNGSYDPQTKEITWTIYTNYRENQIDDLRITDEPQENQTIVSDSVVVKELAIEKNGKITEVKTLEGVTSVDEDANTLEINIGETDKAYKIEYRTSLTGLSDIQKEYVNKAEVLDGSESLSKLKAKVGIAKSDTYAEKSGYQDGKQVHWSVKVNLGQQKISNLKLEDTISDNQEYLIDTIKVYHATVDRNGNATRGAEVPADEYELTHTPGEQVFTVEWNNEVEHAFIVEYSTLFFERHGQDVTNSYKVTGDNIIEDGKTDGEGTVTIKQLTSGGGSGEAGYLIIDKVGKKDGVEAPLAGAEFDLIDAETGKVLKSGTTDEDGQIDFGRLLFGDYELHERVVPDGYVTLNERQTITINKKFDPEVNKQEYAYTVENFEPVFAIELFKTDDENNALAGAEFSLFDSQDNKIATETTNNDGKIFFEDLKESGIYYVQETKAPKGFVLDSTKHKVTVGEKEKEPVKISVKNTPRGAVLLTKVDIDTNERLAGVEFDLQKLNDDGTYITVDTFTTDEQGYIKTSNTLEAGKYQFVETKPLAGYQANSEPIKFDVDVNETNTQTFTMENEQIKGSVKLIKSDAKTHIVLPGAEFKLVDSEGHVVRENLITEANGTLQIDNLFLGEYQLIETKAPEGYELDTTPINIHLSEDSLLDFADVRNHKITNISVEKRWNNGGAATQPVTVKLLPTEETVELNERNNWKATFKDLRVYDDSGDEIDYQVEEIEVDGYQSTVGGNKEDGFIITNTKTTTVSGTKTWLDDNVLTDRPESITVNLKQNGVVVDKKTVTAEDDWKYSFEDLKQYDEDGNEYTYTVTEHGVPGYTSEVDGYDITNTRSEKTSVEITKSWLDDNSDARPDSITVTLFQNGEQFKEIELKAEDNWTYEFVDLDAFDKNGVAYEYTVEEEAVEGYATTINGYDITNLRVGKTEVSGTKTWTNDLVTDRPEYITVQLLQNGTVIDTKDVTAGNEWHYNFTDLDKYDKSGVAYEYTVNEKAVTGYEPTVDKFDITNQFILGSVKLIKVDRNNHSRKLKGAVFKLQGEEGDDLQTGLTTDENGEIFIEDLRPGKYQFIETKAPSGYRIDRTPIEFEIALGQKETLELVKENTRRPTGGGTPPPTDPEDPEPEDPNGEDPEDPNGEDPEDPNGEDPEDPNGEDPEDPNGEDPEDPNGEDPEDPNSGDSEKPGKPTDPEDPKGGGSKKPGKPSTPGISIGVGQQGGLEISGDGIKVSADGNKLPKTATNMYNWIFVGLGLFISGIAALFILRRKKRVRD